MCGGVVLQQPLFQHEAVISNRTKQRKQVYKITPTSQSPVRPLWFLKATNSANKKDYISCFLFYFGLLVYSPTPISVSSLLPMITKGQVKHSLLYPVIMWIPIKVTHDSLDTRQLDCSFTLIFSQSCEFIFLYHQTLFHYFAFHRNLTLPSI